MILCLNGKLVESAEARLPVWDQGLLFGWGVFETVRAYGGRVFRLGGHLERLRRGAGVLGIPVPWPDDALAAALHETLAANGWPEGTARLTLTAGGSAPEIPSPLPADPGFFVLPRSPRPPPAEDCARGAAAVVANLRQHSRNPLAQVKSLNFGLYLLARRDARSRGADEALILNEREEVVEASISNVFMLRDGVLHIPPPDAGCLPGITRGVVLDLARELGLQALEVPFTVETLRTADEAFLTSSGLELMPLVHLEERPVGGGTPGPVTRRLAAAYRDRVASELAGPA